MPEPATQATAIEFQTVHDTYRARVLRYLNRLLGPLEAEDVVQEVMLRISENLPNFRGDAALSTWIYRIATNAALDRLRSRSFQDGQRPESFDQNQPMPIEESEEPTNPAEALSPSVETTAIHDEMNACIREFIERLPENYKTVLVLSEIEGFTNSEIGEILDVSLDTVKIRLHRAREKLRQALQTGCNFHRDERNEFACDRKP